MANIELSRSMRLDQYVIGQRPRLSRGYAVKIIENGQVLVNGKIEKPGYKLRPSDTITIDFDQDVLDVVPSIDLPVLYEDDNVIVVNKPTGVISHARGRYWDEPSVASFIRNKVNDDMSKNDNVQLGVRAGIVHRLDRATSGVMICAKNSQTLSYLQRQFGDRKVAKTYYAVIQGSLDEPEAIIDMPIERNPKAPSTFRVGPNGKSAVTRYIVKQMSGTYSLVELRPQTGRTHQLRVHLHKIGHPIVGDTLYDGQKAERLYLHAHTLTLDVPDKGVMTFEAPVPHEFKAILED